MEIQKFEYLQNEKMSYQAYNFIMKRITRSLNIFLKKEEIKLLKFYFIYIKNWKLKNWYFILTFQRTSSEYSLSYITVNIFTN